MSSNQEINKRILEKGDGNNSACINKGPKTKKGLSKNENSDQIDFERLTPEKIVLISKNLEQATREGVGRLRYILPYDRIVNLLELAMEVFKMESTLLELEISDESATVAIVGDTHGQYHDVLHMFEVKLKYL